MTASLTRANNILQNSSRFVWATQRNLLNGLSLVFSDALAVLLAATLLNQTSHGSLSLELWVLGLWLLLAALNNLYPAWGMARAQELRTLTRMASMVFLASIAIETSLQVSAPKPMLLNWLGSLLLVGFALVFCVGLRSLTREILASFGVWGTPTLVMGHGAALRQVLRRLWLEPGFGFVPTALLEVEEDQMSDTQGLKTVRRVLTNTAPSGPGRVLTSTTPGLDKTKSHIGAVVVACNEPRLSKRLSEEAVLLVPRVVMLSDPLLLDTGGRENSELLMTEIGSKAGHALARMQKRILDWLLLLLAAPIWIPVLAAVTTIAALELRAWPWLSEERIGRHNKTIRLFRLHQTKLTQPLRALPLLVNVARGDITLVGPRPISKAAHDSLPKDLQMLRAALMPGLCGLWMLRKRWQPGLVHMLRHDLHYLRNWSLWLDLVILARAVAGRIYQG